VRVYSFIAVAFRKACEDDCRNITDGTSQLQNYAVINFFGENKYHNEEHMALLPSEMTLQ
jgi:hypothetical protein